VVVLQLEIEHAAALTSLSQERDDFNTFLRVAFPLDLLDCIYEGGSAVVH
jgi:hypothetical protein